MSTSRYCFSVPVRSRREPVETEVAFYAGMTQFAVTELGVNQNIVFDQSFNNIGDHYSPIHGYFKAPVPGTYVFHVTLACKDVHGIDKHFHAKIDVNGTEVSSFIVTPGDQSSQMIVVNLDAGTEVSVRNGISGDSVFGGEWSTFSGFLLYERFVNPATIVG